MKRRKASVSLPNAQIERTWITDSQVTSASDNKDTNQKCYDAIQIKRSLDVQTTRGAATPQVRKVSNQSYSFLERKRLGILKSGLIKSQDFDDCQYVFKVLR